MPRRPALLSRLLRSAVAAAAAGGLAGCGPPAAPAIEFTRVPDGREGGPDRREIIAGRVAGVRRGQQIVLFAKSGQWWVQPFANQPFTAIREDSTWQGTTHMGTEYAALLVDAAYRPPARISTLPTAGNGVVTVATVEGRKTPASTPRILRWSGYEWKVRAVPSDRGGHVNGYLPENAWVDDDGALHLRITTEATRFACAEVGLTRSLGYGTYSVVLRDASRLDPRSVLGAFTWDELAPERKYREMSMEISRWGDPASKNAQFMVQPYYVPANVSRFVAPGGPLALTLRWDPGQARFRASRAGGAAGPKALVAEQLARRGPPPAAGGARSGPRRGRCVHPLRAGCLDPRRDVRRGHRGGRHPPRPRGLLRGRATHRPSRDRGPAELPAVRRLIPRGRHS
jgi:hypothetical protein